MKRKIGAIISSLIILALMIAIVFTLSTLSGGASKQVRESMNFVKKLNSVNALGNIEQLKDSDFKEVKNSSKSNSLVKYTLVTNNFGIDLDKEYNVVGFLNNVDNKAIGNVISEDEAIEYASKYLSEIITSDYKLKGIREVELVDANSYTVVFYKYYKKYISYSSEITIKINKYNGELMAYSSVLEDEDSFISKIEVKEKSASEIAIKYLKDMNLIGIVEDEPILAYIKVETGINKLCYHVNVKITEGEDKDKVYTVIIDAETANVLKSSLDATKLMPIKLGN